MLKEFWDKNKSLIEFTGVMAALSGIFINIERPSNILALEALTNLKVFFLIVLLVFLIILSYSFIKMIYIYKGQNFKSTLLVRIFKSIIVATVFIYVILNLSRYIINFDFANTSYSIVMLVFSFFLIWLFDII
ncbi:MAG: hypothetical protein NTV72_00110 [Candidatus Taylorbacteria bacterium]|nr:hypothetical protein [Candidatus Taylorbacteria bacterium]